MTSKTYTVLTCDRCGRENKSEVEKNGYPDGWCIMLIRDNKWNGKDDKKDLCSSCTISLHQLLEGMR